MGMLESYRCQCLGAPISRRLDKLNGEQNAIYIRVCNKTLFTEIVEPLRRRCKTNLRDQISSSRESHFYKVNIETEPIKIKV